MLHVLEKRAAILGVVLAVLLAGAIWVTVRDRTDGFTTDVLFPGFAEQVQTVQRVHLYTAGDELAVELVRDGEAWSVTQRDGYPAEIGKIGVLLENLAELTILEPKTASTAHYAILGVEDVSAADAQGTRVLVLGENPEAPLINLIVGKPAAGQAIYARRIGEAQSWLVNYLEAPPDPTSWLASSVVHVDSDRIHQAVIGTASRSVATFTRAERGAGDFVASGLSRNRRLVRPSAANGISTALISIENEDVRRRDTLEQPPAARATYHTFDGLVIEVTGWAEDDQHWISLTPSFDEALAARFADNTETAAGALGQALEQVQQEVEQLTRRLTGWAFQIPSYKYDGIFPEVERWLE